ncbi:MAG: anaerobic ribonucleoside-triphosphate reductase [Thermoproteota archaeon]
MEEEGKGFKELSEIFKALAFPIRIEILKILDKNSRRYSELMKTVKLDRFNDAGKFAYHLSKLMENGLVEYRPENKIYAITLLGKDVLNYAMGLFESLRKRENVLMVRRSDSSIELFDRKRIEECLVREAGMDQEVAETIALEIEDRLYSLGIKYLTAPLIREYVNAVLLEKKMENYRHKLTRLGLPVYDVSELTSSKQSVNKVISEAGEEVMRQYAFLIRLSREIGDANLSGLVNINHLANFLFKPDEPFNSLTNLCSLRTYSFMSVSISPQSLSQVSSRLLGKLDDASSHSNSLLVNDPELAKEFFLSILLSQDRWNIVITADEEQAFLGFLNELEKIAGKVVLSNTHVSLVGFGKKIFEDDFKNRILSYLNSGGVLILVDSDSCPTYHFLNLEGPVNKHERTGILGSVSINLPYIFEKATSNEDAFWEEADRAIDRVIEALRLERESLKTIVDNRKLPPFSTSMNGEPYLLVEKMFSTIELIGVYDVAGRITSSQSVSDNVSEAEKIVKKIREMISSKSDRDRRMLVSMICHEEALQRFKRTSSASDRENNVNVIPKMVPLEEWFRFESRIKGLVPETNTILLRSLEEAENVKKSNNTSIVIYNPVAMCASCGRIYPLSREGCVCGSSARSPL